MVHRTAAPAAGHTIVEAVFATADFKGWANSEFINCPPLNVETVIDA
jgi:hypothetical protein